MTGIETGSLFLIISSIMVLTILLPIVGTKKMYYTYNIQQLKGEKPLIQGTHKNQTMKIYVY
jgi:hypothetical protein